VAAKKRRPKRAPTPAGWPERLKRLRARHDWTQTQLAARLRISQSQVSAFLSGSREPTRPIAYLIELLENGTIS
jgi:transcriptional regulator with XRE-family HTH domain